MAHFPTWAGVLVSASKQERGITVSTYPSSKPLIALMLTAIGSAVPVPAEQAGDTPWARVTEDDRAIKIETDVQQHRCHSRRA